MDNVRKESDPPPYFRELRKRWNTFDFGHILFTKKGKNKTSQKKGGHMKIVVPRLFENS